MTNMSPQQWMIEQHQFGHSLCLILDSEDERQTRQALLDSQDADQYCSVYSETPVADLADAGPFMFLIENPEDGQLNELLKAPERNWGWLASIPLEAGLQELVKHWRERLIVGTRPYQALYRFHDNRVLTRALKHLATEAIAGYLGPIISVCYWQGQHWETLSNPAPGNHPAPESPAWCPVGAYTLDQLPGKTVKLKIKLADEEQPGWGDTWVKVPNGWKRCIGEGPEDQRGYCNGNYKDFSSFKMPDGRDCTIYPGCTE